MSRYTDTVDRNMEGLEALSAGLCGGCDECRESFADYVPEEVEYDPPRWRVPARSEESYTTEENALGGAREAFADDVSFGVVEGAPYFSRYPCDICGSRLGGDREVYHYWYSGRLCHDSGACSDCVAYLANGTEPEGWDQ